MKEYYSPNDLKKFTDIKNLNQDLGNKFFEYYGSVFADSGVLTTREKALIGLAVAHTLKCPYCIESLTQTCLEKGADEKQMMEAVHVAASMAAGVTLVHSVQMMNKIKDLEL